MFKTFYKQILNPQIDENNYRQDDRLDLKSSREDDRFDPKSSCQDDRLDLKRCRQDDKLDVKSNRQDNRLGLKSNNPLESSRPRRFISKVAVLGNIRCKSIKLENIKL